MRLNTRIRAKMLLTPLVLLLVAACSGGGETNTPEQQAQSDQQQTGAPTTTPSPLPVIKTAQPTSGTNLRVEINKVSSDSHGFTVVYWTLINTGSDRFMPQDMYGTRRYTDRSIGGWYAGETAPKVELVSKQTGQRYFSLVNSEKTCLCAELYTEWFFMDPDQSASLFNTYYLPPDLQTVTIEIPGFKPIKNVPVA